MSAPEFARAERLDAIGGEARDVTVRAEPSERAALATRFGMLAVEALEGAFQVRREAAGIAVSGRVTARVVQPCSVTGEPIAATIDEPVSLRFVTAGGAGDDERELDAGDIDTVELDGAAIDLGEVAAETMALALDPFPRSPRAAAALAAAGVLSEDEARPAGALAGLKALLSKDGGG